MKYPKFLKINDTIGICAPSAGVGKNIDDFIKSINNLKESGFNIIETESVRKNKEVSTTPKKRAEELHELLLNKDVDMIMCAAGGDFLYDMLPYIDYDLINQNEKWIMGASDPTTLLYTITTKLDIATIYGHNAGSFDAKKLHKSQEYALDVLKGKINIQNSYKKYEKDRSTRINNNYSLTDNVEWITVNDEKEIDISGRIIGGCIDCLRYLPGTKYDYTKDFIEKYKEDGIIWYFDIFSMTTEDFYLTLIQLKEAGWFKYIKGVIVGRVIYPNSYTSMTYERALKEVFKVPVIYNADIGHVPPKMTIINGSYARIKYKDKMGSIEQSLI